MRTVYLLPVLALLSFQSAASNDLSLLVGAKSFHLQTGYEENEWNPSIGVEYRDFVLMYIHKNSYENKSVYAAWAPEVIETKYVDFGFILGLSTGYNEVEYYKGQEIKNSFVYNNIAPVAGFTANVKLHERFSLKTSLMTGVIITVASIDF